MWWWLGGGVGVAVRCFESHKYIKNKTKPNVFKMYLPLLPSSKGRDVDAYKQDADFYFILLYFFVLMITVYGRAWLLLALLVH